MEVDISLEDAISKFEEAQQSFKVPDSYYNAEPRDLAVGLATPPSMRKLIAQVGVPRIYINAIAERLAIEGFTIGDSADSDELLWSWFKANGLDNFSSVAFCEALVYGRSYITVSAPLESDAENPLAIPDIPIIKVESPKTLYAQIDPRTRQVEWAVRVVKNTDGDTVAATLYTPDSTEYYESEDGDLKQVETVNHALGVVPVVPMVHVSDSADLYGTSLITPEIQSVTDAMSRLLMNMQTTSELMANPQRYLFGTTKDELTNDGETSAIELYAASFITVEDSAGKAQQLPAAELRNYTDGMGQLLKLAASYTGLPPQYLSTASDNPASAEAIRASESRLIRECEVMCSQFGSAWEQAMRIALLVMGTSLTIDHFRIETVWRDPATPTLQAKADASTKAYASGNGIIPREQARIDMGYSPEQRRQMRIWDNDEPDMKLANVYGGVMSGPEGDGAEAEGDNPPDGE